MHVLKADGQKEEFDKRKIITTCVRSGISYRESVKIANKIESKISDGETTRKIYELTLNELERKKNTSSFIYKLRTAVSEIDSVSFEKFASDIISAYGYSCKLRQIIQGEAIEHEVDVVAKKRGDVCMVECKHHKNPHRYCGLGTVIETWGRIDDINNGENNFNRLWLFINTKYSEHAKKYAKAKGIRLTGWEYKSRYSLDKMIKEKKVYPVTILDINKTEKRKLMKRGIITLNDLIENERFYNSLDECNKKIIRHLVR